ncbi:lytic transglycosylase domain-containing protein [Rhizobium sp. TH2]|uniref:lytic transglycosylase domain-containing protein n=2 Tax=Rhizobium sp. TH2 TaxID=2775403 RepID=UPI0021578533|nr:lytic transglycosylase domain-containing protein [Rhizobium sp. TH2]UVC10552.1 lytic transglycosylase domain-containing protein [Rhizobium sp. TH2]
MKQGIIAFLVVLAGCFSAFAILGLGSAPPEDAAPLKTVTVKLNVEKAPETVVKLAETSDLAIKTSDKVDRVASVETASIETDVSVSDTAPVVADLPKPVPSTKFLEGMTELAKRHSLEAIAYRDQLERDSAEWKTLSWAIAISGQRAVPSKMIAETQALLKDWPGQKEMQANFEEALFQENPSPNLIVTAFDKKSPSTSDGTMILARAALATGDKTRAASVIRALWSGEKLDEAEEDRFIKEFGELLTAADHKRRMDFLLYKERYQQAERFSEFGEAQSLFDAFSAVGRKTKDADKKIDAVDAKWHDDPSYLYIKIKRHRQLQEYDTAAKLLEKTPKDATLLADPGAWWVEARIVTRGLIDAGNVKAAYRLASAHVAIEPDDLAEAEFHAGWYAFRGLKDRAKAEAHFNKLLAASPKAHDQARGFYWLGRTFEKSNREKSKDYFERATEYPATFYGQLSAARMKVAIKPGHRYAVTDADRLAFASRPEIIGLSLIEQSGEAARARRLYLALAATLENPVDIQQLASKALETHGSTLALAIGKTALKQGHDPGLAAFPLGAIPETADISGAGKALAYAIARQESAFNPQAVSPANARGLLQLLPSTAKRVAKQYQMAYADEKLTEDPAFNATLGSHYLGEQISKFDGSLIMTFAAYNAGPSRVTQWIRRYGDPRGKDIDVAVDWVESIPFTETRDYVQRVMENYQVYKLLLSETPDIAADMTAGR